MIVWPVGDVRSIVRSTVLGASIGIGLLELADVGSSLNDLLSSSVDLLENFYERRHV